MNNAAETKMQKRTKGIETAKRIMGVSAGLFAHKGYDSVTLRDIADAAGIRESSLYNHFNGKAAILQALFENFIEAAPASRPSETEIDRMLSIMQPEEVFKNIVFHVGSHVSDITANTIMVINYEKFRNPAAAEIYHRYVVNEPADYYERIINKMIAGSMVKPVDARMFAEQYNYISIALTKEYFMAQNGLADMEMVVRYMVKTINFFCGLMKS